MQHKVCMEIALELKKISTTKENNVKHLPIFLFANNTDNNNNNNKSYKISNKIFKNTQSSQKPTDKTARSDLGK